MSWITQKSEPPNDSLIRIQLFCNNILYFIYTASSQYVTLVQLPWLSFLAMSYFTWHLQQQLIISFKDFNSDTLYLQAALLCKQKYHTSVIFSTKRQDESTTELCRKKVRGMSRHLQSVTFEKKKTACLFDMWRLVTCNLKRGRSAAPQQ